MKLKDLLQFGHTEKALSNLFSKRLQELPFSHLFLCFVFNLWSSDSNALQHNKEYVNRKGFIGMFDNLKIEFSTPQIINSSEHHMALVFLVDTSASMGAPIRGTTTTPLIQLSAALNRFKAEVCQDEQTKGILDIALIEFNSQYRVLQEFAPVEYMRPLELEPFGSTYLSMPLHVALNMVNERSRFYRRAGAEPYKPWIIIVTDGITMDSADASNQIIQEVNSMVSQDKVAVWALVTGDAADDTRVLNNLHRFCGKRVLKLDGYDFTGFFDWTNKSMRAVSQSVPGDKVKGQALPSTVTINNVLNNANLSMNQKQSTLESFPPLRLSVTSAGCDDIGSLLQSMGIPFDNYKQVGFNCDILFVNCLTFDRINPTDLRDFVANGGCLYASCYADKLIKKAFPGVFVTDHSGEPHWENVVVEDKELQKKIGEQVAINFDTVWAKLYVAEGQTCILRSSSYDKNPIMVSVRWGKGIIFYTCFHNHSQTSEDEKTLLKMMVLRQLGEIRDKTLEDIGNEYGIGI